MIYNSPLFQGLTPSETDALLANRHRVLYYKAGDIIALQGTPYKSLYIIAEGCVRGEMTNPAGERIVIEEISSPRSIAPAFLYATDNTLPVDVIAETDTMIYAIPIQNFTVILQQDIRLLTNFIRSMSDRSRFLSERVRLLRFGTIKSKLGHYLLEQIQRNKSNDLYLPHTHQELADLFGVTRPALSRAMAQLTEENIIIAHKNHIIISAPEKLQLLIRHK